jgi:hypothetical protein
MPPNMFRDIIQGQSVLRSLALWDRQSGGQFELTPSAPAQASPRDGSSMLESHGLPLLIRRSIRRSSNLRQHPWFSNDSTNS